METRLNVSGGSEPLKKAIGAAKQQSGHQKNSNFSACKAQDNQHKIGLRSWNAIMLKCFSEQIEL